AHRVGTGGDVPVGDDGAGGCGAVTEIPRQTGECAAVGVVRGAGVEADEVVQAVRAAAEDGEVRDGVHVAIDDGEVGTGAAGKPLRIHDAEFDVEIAGQGVGVGRGTGAGAEARLRAVAEIPRGGCDRVVAGQDGGRPRDHVA